MAREITLTTQQQEIKEQFLEVFKQNKKALKEYKELVFQKNEGSSRWKKWKSEAGSRSHTQRIDFLCTVYDKLKRQDYTPLGPDEVFVS